MGVQQDREGKEGIEGKNLKVQGKNQGACIKINTTKQEAIEQKNKCEIEKDQKDKLRLI